MDTIADSVQDAHQHLVAALLDALATTQDAYETAADGDGYPDLAAVLSGNAATVRSSHRWGGLLALPIVDLIERLATLESHLLDIIRGNHVGDASYVTWMNPTAANAALAAVGQDPPCEIDFSHTRQWCGHRFCRRS